MYELPAATAGRAGSERSRNADATRRRRGGLPRCCHNYSHDGVWYSRAKRRHAAITVLTVLTALTVLPGLSARPNQTLPGTGLPKPGHLGAGKPKCGRAHLVGISAPAQVGITSAVVGPQPCRRTAYLPETAEGEEILRLFRIAWQRRLLFQVGASVSPRASVRAAA